MSTYTEITDAEIDVDSPVTQVLLTKFRENPIATGQRATGAPKIFGVPYDRQVFTGSGTWTKPSNAEAGDTVVVWGIGGGGSGARSGSNAGSGGGGGAGFLYRIADIGTIAATMTVTIGAGAAVNTSNNGSAGGNTVFGTSGSAGYCRFTGGVGGLGSGAQTQLIRVISYSTHLSANATTVWEEGAAGNSANSSGPITGGSSHWGGGGGGGDGVQDGGFSSNAGHGGKSGSVGNGETGAFPGGGGGAARTGLTAGGGGDGYMVVYSIKES